MKITGVELQPEYPLTERTMATLEENLIPVELKRSGSVDEMGKLSCTAVRFGEYNVVPSSTRDEITIKVSKKGFEIDLSCTDYCKLISLLKHLFHDCICF